MPKRSASVIARRGEAVKAQAAASAAAARANAARHARTAAASARPADTFDFDAMVAAAGREAASSEDAPRLVAFASLSMPAASLRQMIDEVGTRRGRRRLPRLPGQFGQAVHGRAREGRAGGRQQCGRDRPAPVPRLRGHDGADLCRHRRPTSTCATGSTAPPQVPPHDRMSRQCQPRPRARDLRAGLRPGRRDRQPLSGSPRRSTAMSALQHEAARHRAARDAVQRRLAGSGALGQAADPSQARERWQGVCGRDRDPSAGRGSADADGGQRAELRRITVAVVAVRRSRRAGARRGERPQPATKAIRRCAPRSIAEHASRLPTSRRRSRVARPWPPIRTAYVSGMGVGGGAGELSRAAAGQRLEPAAMRRPATTGSRSSRRPSAAPSR